MIEEIDEYSSLTSIYKSIISIAQKGYVTLLSITFPHPHSTSHPQVSIILSHVLSDSDPNWPAEAIAAQT